MPFDASTLRRMIADHERALVELKAALAEITGEANGVDVIDALRLHCIAQGIAILPGDLLRSKDVARLIDRSPKTLANWRSDLAADLPSVDFNGKPAYRLADVARYLKNLPG